MLAPINGEGCCSLDPAFLVTNERTSEKAVFLGVACIVSIKLRQLKIILVLRMLTRSSGIWTRTQRCHHSFSQQPSLPVSSLKSVIRPQTPIYSLVENSRVVRL